MSETTEQKLVVQQAATDAQAARIKNAAAAIVDWQSLMLAEVKARIDAAVAEARALLASRGGNDAARKADATIQAENENRAAGEASARARAAGAMVDLLLGGRAPIQRWP